MLLEKQKATFCLLFHQPITHSYSLVENISSAGANPYSCPGAPTPPTCMHSGLDSHFTIFYLKKMGKGSLRVEN